MIIWKCRQCGSDMEAPDGLIGEHLKCPHCNTRQLIPEPPRSQLANQNKPTSINQSTDIIASDGQRVITSFPGSQPRIIHRRRWAIIIASGLITTGIIITLVVQSLFGDPSKVPPPGASQAVVQRHCEWAVKHDLESRIYDPSSLEYVKFSDAFRLGNTFYIQCSYRARNGLGAMILTTEVWTIIDGRVVSVDQNP